MTREQIVSFSLIGLLIFVIVQVFALLSPFATALFWSGILAFTFYPAYKGCRRLIKTGETVTAFVFTVLIILIVIPPMVLLVLNITQQAIDLYQWALDYVRQGRLAALIQTVRDMPALQNMQERVPQWELIQDSLASWILNTTRSLGNYTAGQVAIVTRNTLFVLLNIVMMAIMVFVFLKDGERIYNYLYNIMPLEQKNKDLIFGQLNDTFAAVIRGQLLTSVVQATISGLAFWALSIPAPLLFAALTFIISMVPVVGAAGIWFPLVLYLYFHQAYVQAGILFAFGVFFISLIDNVLKPAIIGEKTKLPYFLLFFGMLGGLKVYGLMGIFLAPVILSLFFALIRIYREKYLSEKN